MPPGSTARKKNSKQSETNRSSSNTSKRLHFSSTNPGNDNSKPDIKLAPVLDIKKIPPKPTGLASPSPVRTRRKSPAKSVGPQVIARPVNQLQIARQLDAERQAERGLDSESPTREEMLADSGDTQGTILPGQFNPLEGSGAYGRKSESGPASMAETPELDIERGGGVMQSDLERQRAMQLEQQKMMSAAGLTGASASVGGTADIPRTPEKPAKTSGAEIIAEESAAPIKQLPQLSQEPSPKQDQLQVAQNLASAAGMERTAKAVAAAQAVKGNLEAIRKAQKTAQSVWNIIKAGELASGVSVLSLFVLILTANLQMINKYSFKTPLVPATFLVEDFIIVCTDCGLCGASCASIFVMPFMLIPFIAILAVMGTIIGIDLLGVSSFLGGMF